jgi:hypothetical protein
MFPGSAVSMAGVVSQGDFLHRWFNLKPDCGEKVPA